MNKTSHIRRFYSNNFYYITGLSFLFLNKIRHSLQGYKTPRTFSVSDYNRAIEYDFDVIDNWRKFLKIYSPDNSTFKNKTLLELCPGEDLGIGVVSLAYGAKKYNAIDINPLAKITPKEFYKKLFNHIERKYKKNVSSIEKDIDKIHENERINYVHCKKFDLSVFNKENIDLVFSQAAFEHFESAEKTLISLSKIAKSGTILITEIDLKTHTRWLRDFDPLNIYRYSDSIYNFFKFSGSPNRMRPNEYEEILEKNDWENIKMIPLNILDSENLSKVQKKININFRDKKNQMDYLSIMLCATKK